LIGEFTQPEILDHPVYTVADSLVVLSQQIERNSVVRKLQVLKVRGQADLPGLHTYRITGDGLTVFPRIPKPEEEPATAVASAEALAPTKERLSTGVRDLDEMLAEAFRAGIRSWSPALPGRGRRWWPRSSSRRASARGSPGSSRSLRSAPRAIYRRPPWGRTLSE
jgi:circadian clock protein KaiC